MVANYRQIHTQIWKDTWFLDLPSDAKLLFIYLFSNERASIAGIYELSIKVMEFETDIDRERIEELLQLFAEAGKAFHDRDNSLIWIVNLRKYNENPSPKVKTRIERDLDAILDCELKMRYIEYYQADILYADPIDTQDIPKLETESEQEQDQEQDHEQEQDFTESPSGDAPDQQKLAEKGNGVPENFQGWSVLVQESNNRPATLVFMYETLFPGRDVPTFGYVGKVARKVGGAGRLAELFWKVSTKPPTGDVLAYVQATAKGKATRAPPAPRTAADYEEGDKVL